jgi:hypothetical protein
VAIVLVIAGCSQTSTAPGDARGHVVSVAVPIERSDCDAEAVLLVEETLVRNAPETSAAIVARLPAGVPVFPCLEADGYRAVMFPAPGERADCATRAADRLCPTGWIDSGAAFDIVG